MDWTDDTEAGRRRPNLYLKGTARMLCLSRKVGQRLIIEHGGQRIVVIVRNIKGPRIGLGVEADAKAVKVYRAELEGKAA